MLFLFLVPVTIYKLLCSPNCHPLPWDENSENTLRISLSLTLQRDYKSKKEASYNFSNILCTRRDLCLYPQNIMEYLIFLFSETVPHKQKLMVDDRTTKEINLIHNYTFTARQGRSYYVVTLLSEHVHYWVDGRRDSF